MTQNERAIFFQKFIDEHCIKVATLKGKEYSRSEVDVNSNFKRVGSALDISPLKAAYIYAAKHWDAITNYIKTERVESEPIEGRLGDLINYCLIIASLIKEIEEEKNANKTIQSDGREDTYEACTDCYKLKIDGHIAGCKGNFETF